MQTNQHHRAVDQEANDDHTGHIDARITRRVQPVNDSGDGHRGHKEHAGGAAVAFKHFVRHPAAQQRARDPRVLVQEIGPEDLSSAKCLTSFR